MRPLPLILLFVALASALVVALLFVGRGESARPDTAKSPASALHASDPHETPASPLDATGASDADANRAAPAAAPAAEPARAAGAAKKETPSVGLAGRVLGNLGKPVEGATVYAAEANDFLGAPLDEIDPDRMAWVRRASATTDHDGRFSIRAEARGKVALAVRAPGFAPLDRELAVSGVERDVGELVLDASVVLAGRVVGANGRAVEGARIARVSGTEGGLPFFGGPTGATVATTNAQGEFRVDQLAAGPWHLLVTHEDHPDHLENGEADRAGAVQSGLLVTLEDGSEIQGRVVGAPAELQSKLSVRAVARGVNGDGVGADSPNAFASSVRSVACAPDGSFTLKGLKPSQRYRLTAQQKTRDFFRGARSAPVTAQAGDHGVELAFRPDTALVFQAVDATSGLPVVELNVQAGYAFTMPLLDDDGRPVKRFPDGRVRYGGLPGAPRAAGQGVVQAGSASGSGLKLRVEAPGYQVLERTDVPVIDGQDNDLGIVKLERAPLVTVLVLDDATSAPIENASVSLVEENPPGDRRQAHMAFNVDEDDSGDADIFASGAAHRARTGPDGKASVTSLPGKSARLRVRRAGYAQHESEAIALPLDQSVERTVRLSVGGSVTVEVVDARGAALAGAEVDHRGPNANAGEMSFSNQDAATDADGKIVFDHLASGKHRFRLRQGGAGGVFNVDGGRAMVRRVSRVGGPEEEGWSAVDVDEHTAATVRLVAPERGTLAGRISEGGKPFPNATVRLSPKGEDATPMPFRSGGKNTHTDSRGEYTFDGVDEGEYSVSIEHATRAMAFDAQTRVRAGENRFDLDLPVAIVEGTVTGEDGKPVAGVRVHAERALAPGGGRRPMAISLMVTADGSDEPEVNVSTGDGGGSTVATDADGRYSLRGVLPDVDLVVEGNGKDTQPARSGNFSVASDQTKKGVDLKLERGGTLVVTVQRPGGAAAGGYLARATLDGGNSVPKVQMVGPSGTTKLTGLKPGKWRVHLDALQGLPTGNADNPIREREVDVQVGETAHATFEIP
jgi:protocatechuate 3,4-dioxygenase beta subunit